MGPYLLSGDSGSARAFGWVAREALLVPSGFWGVAPPGGCEKRPFLLGVVSQEAQRAFGWGVPIFELYGEL